MSTMDRSAARWLAIRDLTHIAVPGIHLDAAGLIADYSILNFLRLLTGDRLDVCDRSRIWREASVIGHTPKEVHPRMLEIHFVNRPTRFDEWIPVTDLRHFAQLHARCQRPFRLGDDVEVIQGSSDWLRATVTNIDDDSGELQVLLCDSGESLCVRHFVRHVAFSASESLFTTPAVSASQLSLKGKG